MHQHSAVTVFKYSADELCDMVSNKDSQLLDNGGGTAGLLTALKSDQSYGLSADVVLPAVNAALLSSSSPEEYEQRDKSDSVSVTPSARNKNTNGGDGGLDGTTWIDDSNNNNSNEEGNLEAGNTKGFGKKFLKMYPRRKKRVNPYETAAWMEDLNHDKQIFANRVEQYGTNLLPPAKGKTLIRLMIEQLKDKFLILLNIAALVSLAIGIYQDVRVTGNEEDDGDNTHWVEGFAIIVAVAVVVIVSAMNDYQKERQFQKLNAKKDYRKVRVVRDGVERMICIQCLMVGDVLHIEPGDILGADAVVLTASNLKCDESSLTGESDAIKKVNYEEMLRLREIDPTTNAEPYLLSGSKVLMGVGTCVIIAVGVNSFYGKTLLASRKEQDPTPLQNKLDKLAGTITKFGSIAAGLMLVALLIKYFIEFAQHKKSRKATDIVNSIVDILIATITIIVVAVPEGLPLAVTLALAVATKRMIKDNCFVRLLASCETMGNATAICSDKTGTLTQNKMTVVTGTLGDQYRFSSYPPGAAKQQRQMATLPPTDGLITDAKGQIIDINAAAAATKGTTNAGAGNDPKNSSGGQLLGTKTSGDDDIIVKQHDQVSERQARRIERHRRRYYRTSRRGSVSSSPGTTPGLSPFMSSIDGSSFSEGSFSNLSMLSEITDCELDMIPMNELPEEGPKAVMSLIHDAIAVNSSAFVPAENEDAENNDVEAGNEESNDDNQANNESAANGNNSNIPVLRNSRISTSSVRSKGRKSTPRSFKQRLGTVVENLPLPKFLKKKGSDAKDLSDDVAALVGSGGGQQNDSDCAFEGSKTEVALLQWSYFMNAPSYKVLREDDIDNYVQCWPFSSENKSMSTLVRIKRREDEKEVWRLYVKGAPEILIDQCKWIIDVDGAFRKQDQDEFDYADGNNNTDIPAFSLDNFNNGNSDAPSSPGHPVISVVDEGDDNNEKGGEEGQVNMPGMPPVPLLRVESTHSETPNNQPDFSSPLSLAVPNQRDDGSSLGSTNVSNGNSNNNNNGYEVHRALSSSGTSDTAIGSASPQQQKLSLPDDFAENQSIPVIPLTQDTLSDLKLETTRYASRALRTIGVAYRDFDNLDEGDIRSLESDLEWRTQKGLVWVGLFGIEDPLRDGVAESVRRCQKAGITVRMVTGDNRLTARAIATQCGIYTPGMGGIIMEGPEFRKLSPEQMDDVVPRLRVLARSSPEDKRVLVAWLRDHSEVVAVTGDGTNDGPALRAANVGFSMGIAGTEVAKEASAIVLMDDNFSSIVKACIWGRCVNDAIKKFLQFQLTVNVTAVLVAFVSALTDDNERAVFTPVQLLWVNLIMDTFAALALATDPPTNRLLDRLPERKDAPLITFHMWKMILIQACYQIAISFLTLYTADNLFDLDSSDNEDYMVIRTIVFNSFVWMQLFNEFNSRSLGNSLNVFYNLHRNLFFIGIVVFSAFIQVLIIQFGGAAFKTRGLDGQQWAYCIIAGALSLAIGVVVRLIPDRVFTTLIPWINLDIYHHHQPLVATADSDDENDQGSAGSTTDHHHKDKDIAL
ncbi:plasma membrane calcium [Mycoemilia scoparia]|uniref:Calcium-transporting ATPase n=1 Tax=Mycoemilia scoparia TaxID=417184 RepID=A0A9W8DPC9_9FUNG|nr:plasma membrane calcium [Mycoemilia scoparia]